MAKKPELDPAGLKAMLDMALKLKLTMDQVDALLGGMTDKQIANANASGEQAEALGRQVRFLEKVAELGGKEVNLAENRRAIAQAQIKDEERKLELALKNGDMSEDEYLKEMLIQAKKKENLGYAEKASKGALSAAQNLTGVSNAWENTTIGGFFQGDFTQNLADTVTELKANFSAANMLGSSLMKVQEATMMMVYSADATFSSVNQLTNGTGEYNDMIMDTVQNNAEWNVSMEDAGEAVGALYTDMSNFSNMTEEAQGHLVETTAQLKGLGIDAQTTAANFEILNGALGMSAEQAAQVQKDFAAMAADLGVSASKIAKDFSANADVFVAYGDDATEVFKEVAGAAKATGIEMSALLAITTKMDTFEGAARAAGQLNSVLGGGLLNSMDLLNASEEERIRMLIQSVEMSGKSWSSMSKFEKQAVANAAGISDMTTASKLFGQSLSEYDEAQRKVEDNAESQEKLAERAAAAASIMDKMKRIMESFAIAVSPIVDTIHFLLNGFINLNNMLGGMLVPTLIGLGSILMIVHYWTKLTAMWSTIMTTKKVIETAVTSGLAAATGVLAVTQSAQATSATAATPATFGLATAISAVSAAVVAGGPFLAAFSMAIAGIGAAIAAPFIAIAVLVWSLKELVIAFMEMPDAIMPALFGLIAFGAASMVALPMLAMGIAMFVGILASVAPFMLPVAIGLMHLSAAAIVFGIAAWFLGQGFKLLSEGVKNFPIMDLVLLGLALIPFGVALMLAAIPFIIGGTLVGIGALLLGFGLQVLASGIEGFTKRGMFQAMFGLTFMLILFGVGLILAAIPFAIGASLIAIPAILLGFGLKILASGIEGFTKRGMFEAMGNLTYMLVAFGIGLIYAAIPFGIGATLVGVAALILGAGLIVLAKGLKPFTNGSMLETMFLLPFALAFFSLGLLVAAFPLMYAGAMLLIGALTTTPALLLLWLGVKPWMGMDFEKMKGLGAALDEMTNGFFWTGFWLMFSGPMLLAGALYAAPALMMLALAVLPWMAMDWKQLTGLGWMLAELGAGLLYAGIAFLIAGYPFLLGALMISVGMLILNQPLRSFAETLAILAPIAGILPAIAMGLMILGWALPGFAYGILMLGIAASLPFFSTGMNTLVKGLKAFAQAFEGISEKKAVALGNIFKGLTLFTELGGVGKVMSELAWGILQIAWALQEIPAEKSIALSIAADSFTGMMKVAMKVKPEAIETVKTMASAAADYATASQRMREPEKDALVQAIKEAMGGGAGKKGAKSGQDIVLEVDGNEFARAVDVAINKRHSTSGW